MKSLHRFTIVFIVCIFAFFQYLSAQQITDFEAFSEKFAQQKIYLHSDKDVYFAGDRIWFKAWVLQAHSHVPDTAESTIFVELLDYRGELIRKEVLQAENGFSQGSVLLRDSLSEGNYTLRAYTQWMLNFHEDFIFQRNLFIRNPEEMNYISRRQIRRNRRINRDAEKLSGQNTLKFFPEGGSLIDGVPARIAYFASNELGEGVPVKGVLTNDRGTVLAELSASHGRGSFVFTPSAQERYTVRASLDDGRTQQFNPGRILQTGISIGVEEDDGRLKIHARGTTANPVDSVYLLLHARGVVKYLQPVGVNELPYTLVPDAENLKPGIMVATVFDNRARILSERMFFNFPPLDNEQVISRQQIADDKLSVSLHLPAFAADSNAVSLSVTASLEAFPEPENSGLHTILLRSDLPVSLMVPAALTLNMDKELIDLLMLSAGWKRFDMLKPAAEQFSAFRFARHNGFPIYGNIMPTPQSRELQTLDFEVSILAQDEDRMQITRADRDGNFRFEGFAYEGDFEAEITVMGLAGSNAMQVELFPEQISGPDGMPNYAFRPLNQRRGAAWRRASPPKQPPSQRIVHVGDNLRYHYGNPDQIIYLRETDIRFNNMRDVLRGSVSGLVIEGNQILIRGVSSIRLSNQPLLLVDGQEYGGFQFLNLSPLDISHVEVYKGTSTSIFGLRGANGVIVAHTRRSNLPYRLIMQYVLAGYYVPTAFDRSLPELRSPFLDHPEYIRTLHWEPNLDVDAEGNASIELPLPASYHSLKIVLEGVDKQGNVLYFNKLLSE